MKTARYNGPLEIQPNFLMEQADVNALMAGIELGLDIASQPAFRDLIKSQSPRTRRMSREETLAFLRRSCSTYFHPVGTCAMGSGKEAVVDAELRVHGIDGLRVVNASIMPTITSANTNAPTVMIGEFASRLIVAGATAVRSHKAAAHALKHRFSSAEPPNCRCPESPGQRHFRIFGDTIPISDLTSAARRHDTDLRPNLGVDIAEGNRDAEGKTDVASC